MSCPADEVVGGAGQGVVHVVADQGAVGPRWRLHCGAPALQRRMPEEA